VIVRHKTEILVSNVIGRPPEVSPTPPRPCPFCASTDVTITGKPTASSYLRCVTCGEVWHPDRLHAGAIPARWRR